jgi:hypothetical protein
MRKNGRYMIWLVPVALVFAVSAAGCLKTRTYVFEKRIGIAASPSKIFSIVSNFKGYPAIFPESHKQVTIVTGATEGNGVGFDNVAVYKGRFVTSRWNVTEFVRDRLIRMDSDTAGTIIIMLHQVDYDTTEETMIASVSIPPQFKDDLFALYDNEMKALKVACEQHAPADTVKK